MLVLSRKRNEALILGTGPDAIRILVVGIGRHGDPTQVRLGIEAPKDVLILRGELVEDNDHLAKESPHV